MRDNHHPTPKPSIPFRTSYEMAVAMLNAEEASIKSLKNDRIPLHQHGSHN